MKNTALYYWDIYEITTKSSPIHGVGFRGTIRKFTKQNNINLLTENASDQDNTVRFALTYEQKPEEVINFITSLAQDVSVKKVLENIANPVLSKLKVNIDERYTI